MEKKVSSFKEYEIFMADKSCLNEIANFVVRENYSHHMSSFTEEEINKDIKSVLEEEGYLYDYQVIQAFLEEFTLNNTML